MKAYLYAFLLLTCFTMSCSSVKKLPTSDDIALQKQEIMAILTIQEQAWSRGDIDAFMEGYWNSDKMKFIGSRGLNYGWQKTKDNYKKSYATPEKMGKLQFTILDHDYISADAAHLTGKYELIRANDRPTGYFTLVFKKIAGTWKIVSDHTSG